EPGCAAGAACDDGDPCTVDDACDAAGVCLGTPMACDDGVTCTSDQCVAGECVHETMAGLCLADGACAATGTAAAGNPCRLCRPEGGVATLVDAPDGDTCSDGDQCTVGDSCQAGSCVPGAAR